MAERRRIPIACTLSAEHVPDRLGDWRALVGRAVGPVEVTDTGRRARFPGSLEPEVRRLVAAESACCAFFEFDVAVEGGEVMLSVGAPPEARPLVDALLAPGS